MALNEFGRDENAAPYRIDVDVIVGKIEDGKMRPGASYDGMTREAIAADYLSKCDEFGVCAGCNNSLDDEDREFSGKGTNACISCACY
jgi:hypothetical protein